MYEKVKIEDVAVKSVALFDALSDGVGVEDSDELMALISSVVGAASAFQADKDAAVLHYVSKIVEEIGDRRVGGVDPVT